MTILPMRIDISLNESRQEYELQAEQNRHDFSVNSAESILVNNYRDYEGPYEVTPKVTDQTLGTKNKHMLDDVHVKEIPYYETSNVYNGLTVFIGGSLDD